MAGPSTTLLDNFNRANGAPGANWPGAIRSSKVLFTIVSNTATNTGSGSTDEGYWTTQYGAAQECYFTLTALPSTADAVRLHARIQSPGTASPTSYILDYTVGSPSVLTLFYFNGSTYTQIGTPANITLGVGDKMCLRAVGNTLTGEVYQSGAWSVQTSGTDSNITGAGYIGMAMNGTTATLDDFGGGVVTSFGRTRALVQTDPLPATRTAAGVPADSQLIAVRRTAGSAPTRAGAKFINADGVPFVPTALAPDSVVVRVPKRYTTRARWQFIQADGVPFVPTSGSTESQLIGPKDRPALRGAPRGFINADAPANLIEPGDSILFGAPRQAAAAPPTKAGSPPIISDSPAALSEAFDSLMLSVPRTPPAIAPTRAPRMVVSDGATGAPISSESLMLAFPRSAARWPLGLLTGEGVQIVARGESLIFAFPRSAARWPLSILVADGAQLPIIAGESVTLSVPRGVLPYRVPAFIVVDAVGQAGANGANVDSILIAVPREEMLRFYSGLRARDALMRGVDAALSARDAVMRGRNIDGNV